MIARAIYRLRTLYKNAQPEGSKNPSLSNMGEGFNNWGFILVGKNSILDMKGLSFYMPRFFLWIWVNPSQKEIAATSVTAKEFVHLFVHLPHIHRSTHTDMHGLSLSLITGSYLSGICLGSKHSTTELRPPISQIIALLAMI